MDDAPDIGWWWLPGSPDRRVPGVLELLDTGATRLVINGELVPDHPFRGNLTIYGETPAQGCVTVAAASGPHTLERLQPRVLRQTYEGWITLLGAHLDVFADLEFRAASLWMEGLDDWVFAGSYLRSRADDAGRIIVEPSAPLPITDPAQVGGVEVTIRPSEAFPFGMEQVSVRRSASVGIAPTAGVHCDLDALNRVVRAVQDLVCLLRGGSVRISDIWLDLPPNPPRQDGQAEGYNPIRLIQYGRFHTPEVARVAPYRVVRSYSQVAPRWADALARWFALIEKAGPALDVFFASQYAGQVFVENRFLSLVQAAEAFHRSTRPGFYMEGEAYRREILPGLVAAIPGGIDAAFQDALRSRLRFGNEHALRKRLSDLVCQVPAELARMFRRHGEFISAVVDTRNYLIHLDPAGADSAWTVDRMPILTEHLLTLMRILLLSELGFSGGEIAEGMDFEVRGHIASEPNFA